MKRDEATDAIVKNAAKKTGMDLRGGDGRTEVTMTGRDTTLKQALEHIKEPNTPVIGAKGGAVALEIAENVGKVHHAMDKLPGGAFTGAVVGGIVTAAALVYEGFVKTAQHKAQVKEAVIKDALHAGLLMSLETPRSETATPRIPRFSTGWTRCSRCSGTPRRSPP